MTPTSHCPSLRSCSTSRPVATRRARDSSFPETEHPGSGFAVRGDHLIAPHSTPSFRRRSEYTYRMRKKEPTTTDGTRQQHGNTQPLQHAAGIAGTPRHNGCKTYACARSAVGRAPPATRHAIRCACSGFRTPRRAPARHLPSAPPPRSGMIGSTDTSKEKTGNREVSERALAATTHL